LLSSKPRPLGWAERRQRIDEVGSVWPVAGDVTLAAVDLGGVPGEWSIVPGSDASRVIMCFFTAVVIAPVQSAVTVAW
jgi:epsilon-lactone hydrolase